MTVTVEVINKGSINLLKEMENLGLINLRTSVSLDSEKTSRNLPPSPEDRTEGPQVPLRNDQNSSRWLRGCCKSIPGGSVEDFLSRCREDKEHELAIEKRQEEERERLAKLHP